MDNATRPRARILVVDDDRGIRESLEQILEEDYELTLVDNGLDALDEIGRRAFDLVLLDLSMPQIDGLETLRRIKRSDEQLDVVMISATDKARQAIDAVRSGAYDYVTKPFDPDSIMAVVERVLAKRSMEQELSYLRSEVERRNGQGRIITQADCMKSVLEMVEKVARTSSSVLIIGESGTGKELIARAIHLKSSRARKPFVAINCASIPAELIESELFGYEKGAFTGASRRTIGKLEYADQGSVFLDEIGTLRPELQAQLLRFLQEREVRRVGSNMTIKVDVRVIAATNSRLEEMVREGTFREDLYFRLNVIPIKLPPLRQRKGDIPLLVRYFLGKFNRTLSRSVGQISSDAMAVLENYPWPGNVRELENFIERMVVLGCDGHSIEEGDLPFDLLIHDRLVEAESLDGRDTGLTDARQSFEREYILRVLKRCQGNQAEAARLLKIHRNTLLNKMKSLGLKGDEAGGSAG
jgi:DNA-binding NtrC family response regulator